MEPLNTGSWYEVPVGRPDNLQPAFIGLDGSTWIGAKKIPDRLLHKVWPHMRPVTAERFIELLQSTKK